VAALRNILLALVTPWGRLSQFPFIVLVVLLLCVHAGLQFYLSANIEELQPYNAFSMAQICILWMMFSILSRRFHDSGNAALFLVPYFACTFAAYLFAIDNWKLAVSPFEDDHETAAWFERIRVVFQLIGLGIIIFAFKDGGDTGANAYGPEWGGGQKQRKRTRMSAYNASMAHGRVHFDEPDPTPAQTHEPPSAPVARRGRITPVASATRSQGFGRR
jgi:uncharacterized membrane protein YhaH (DUF805 family)